MNRYRIYTPMDGTYWNDRTFDTKARTWETIAADADKKGLLDKVPVGGTFALQSVDGMGFTILERIEPQPPPPPIFKVVSP